MFKAGFEVVASTGALRFSHANRWQMGKPVGIRSPSELPTEGLLMIHSAHDYLMGKSEQNATKNEPDVGGSKENITVLYIIKTHFFAFII